MSSRKGSVLVLILWSLFFLSALAVAINAYLWSKLGLADRLMDRARLSYLAKAGVKKAMLEVQKDITDSYDTLKDPWSNNPEGFKEVRLAEAGTFSVQSTILGETGKEEVWYGLVDEERKVNINKAPYNVLKSFFETVGRASSQQASEIADSILDWRDEDDTPRQNGAENGYYSTLNPPYPCKNKAFEVLEEVLWVKGMSSRVFEKVKDGMTVYGSGSVNINTADSFVLQSLGMDEALAKKVVHFRAGNDGKEGTSDDNIFESTATIAGALSGVEELSPEELSQLNQIVGAELLSVRSDHFMGRSYGQAENIPHSTRITFVFNRNKAMEYWSED